MKCIQVKNIKIGEGIPKIIVPLMGTTNEQLFEEIKHVKQLQPDIVEWRVDVFENVCDIEAVKAMILKMHTKLSDIPLLFTFRSKLEGGNKEIEHSYYFDLLEAAIETKGIDLIDIEFIYSEKAVKALVQKAKNYGVYVILSSHNFESTPSKEVIISRLEKMRDFGADIPKIAVMPDSTEDLITLLEATNIMKERNSEGPPIITMAMGSTGLISRLAGEVFGSAATFGSGRESSAPGQIAVSELRTVLEILHKN